MQNLPAPTSPACPVCRDPLDAQPFETCATCETPVHTSCREYAGGCVRFACVEATTPRQRMLDAVARQATGQLLAWAAGACFVSGVCIAMIFPAMVGGYLGLVTGPIVLLCSVIAAALIGSRPAVRKWQRARQGRVNRTDLEALAAVAQLGYPVTPYRRAPIDCVPARYRSLAFFLGPAAIGTTAGLLIHFTSPYSKWPTSVGMTLHYIGLQYAIWAYTYRTRLHDELRRRVASWRDELEAARDAVPPAGESVLLEEAVTMKMAKA